MQQLSLDDPQLEMKLRAMRGEERIAAIDMIQDEHFKKFGRPKFGISSLASLGYYTREELDDMGYDPT